MNVQKLASFTYQGDGGNPAGVMIGEELPDPAVMQDIAAEVGFSETAFAAPKGDGFRVRYFAPLAEVPFCGHATIALGAALGEAFGEGQYDLVLNDAEISVTAFREDGQPGATLVSPATSFEPLNDGILGDFLSLFGLERSELDPEIAPALINGGAQHLLLPLASHGALQRMSYDFDAGARLMKAHGLVTINLIWRETTGRIHSRNAFASHGVYEDPATGAAAAALAGYLRDAGIQSGPFEVLQGAEMGAPSLLRVVPQAGRGAPIEISGTTRALA